MEEEGGYRQWSVPEPIAIFLLVHGLGTYSGRWQAMADYFMQHGISSFAIDCPDFKNYYSEIQRLRVIISRSNPGKKIFLVGESLGGIASFIMASRNPGSFAGLVCLSPAFKSRSKLPVTEYIKILIALLYDAKIKFKLPFDFSMCTRDIAYRKKMEADEREQREVSSAAIASALIKQAQAKMSVNRLATPVIFMLTGDDKIIDSGSSIKIFKRLKVKDKTLKVYPDMYHSISIDIGKEKVFQDLLEWISVRI